MAEFVQSVIKAIGTTGEAQHKLGFAIGPLTLDMPDDETRQFIRDAFAVARENDVPVALHIDDSMSWGSRKDLLSNPDNIETADWKQIPNTGRRLAWGPKPTRVPPHMCYNAPAIVAAAKDRARLIGKEIRRELAVLKSAGKEHLFAGVIAGWETQIGRDFETDRPLGFRALAHRGFSEKNPPKDLDSERVGVVKEWMELWANSLRAAGTPREKIFCHIAFTDQGLRQPDAKETYAQRSRSRFPKWPSARRIVRDFPPTRRGGHSANYMPRWSATVRQGGFPPRVPTYRPRACPASRRWKCISRGYSTTGACW